MDVRQRVGTWVGLAACVGVLVAGAAGFLPRQTIWLDETVQLSGLHLGPFEVVGWLAGSDPRDFGQFRDRMPPLSYWLGWAWTRIFGLNETSLRWLGVLATAAATALIYATARRAFGTAAAWGAGLFFAMSPAVLVMAVEIRAYPLFLLGSAASFYFFTRLLTETETETETEPEPRYRDIAGLALALAAAIFTHYFGLVLAGALLVALLAGAVGRGGSWRPVLAVAGVMVLSALAISPFVRQSLGMTHAHRVEPGVLNRLLTVRRLLPGLTSHPAFAVYPLVETLARVSVLGLAFAALATLRSEPGRRVRVALLLALGAGLAAVAVAKVVITGFDAARPIYNAWMWPGISLLLASGLGSSHRGARRTAGLAAGMLVVAMGIGVVQLGRHGTYFAHGPHRSIAGLIHPLGPRNVAVVHDDATPPLVQVACPLHYEFGPELRQYHLPEQTGSGTTRLLVNRGGRLGTQEAGTAAALPVALPPGDSFPRHTRALPARADSQGGPGRSGRTRGARALLLDFLEAAPTFRLCRCSPRPTSTFSSGPAAWTSLRHFDDPRLPRNPGKRSHSRSEICVISLLRRSKADRFYEDLPLPSEKVWHGYGPDDEDLTG